MTDTIIITLTVLVLLAYLFDITSQKTRIPSIILLLFLGWVAKQVSDMSGVMIPDLSAILPVLGTMGLVLIVLDGSLELELNRQKLPLIAKSTGTALISILVISFALAGAFRHITGTDYQTCLMNAIPLAIISSAIAIPSAESLPSVSREFIIYESSLSDIFGVLFFNFVLTENNPGIHSVTNLFFQLLLILIISFAATLLLAFLLYRVKHSVKFIPIIILILLIYSISKLYHLPALLFILLFGLFIRNIDELNIKSLREWRYMENLKIEVSRFKELTKEMTFLIRVLFFLLFGFMIDTQNLLNKETAIWAVAISAGIFVTRILYLWLMKLPLKPLLFIAPRGLITILLFLSIPASHTLPAVNQSLITQVIIITALVMMAGTINTKKQTDKVETDNTFQE